MTHGRSVASYILEHSRCIRAQPSDKVRGPSTSCATKLVQGKEHRTATTDRRSLILKDASSFPHSGTTAWISSGFGPSCKYLEAVLSSTQPFIIVSRGPSDWVSGRAGLVLHSHDHQECRVVYYQASSDLRSNQAYLYFDAQSLSLSSCVFNSTCRGTHTLHTHTPSSSVPLNYTPLSRHSSTHPHLSKVILSRQALAPGPADGLHACGRWDHEENGARDAIGHDEKGGEQRQGGPQVAAPTRLAPALPVGTHGLLRGQEAREDEARRHAERRHHQQVLGRPGTHIQREYLISKSQLSSTGPLNKSCLCLAESVERKSRRASI